MDELNMDFAKVEDAAAQIGNRISGLVSDAFAQTPAAAQAAASVNAGFLTSQALLATCAQIATAIEQLTASATEHAELLRSSARTVRERDSRLAAEHFTASAVFPSGR